MGITIPEGKSGSVFMCLEPNSPPGSLWEPLVCQKMQCGFLSLKELVWITEHR